MALDQFKSKFGLQVADSVNSSAPSAAKIGYDLLPIGSIMYWAGSITSIPTGWLLCDGSTPLRTDYPDLNVLFSAASYPYGNGNGSTTFTLPNANDRALLHGGFPANIYLGNTTTTLTDSNVTSHSHPLGSHTHPMSSHTHTGLTHTHSGGSHTHNHPHNHPQLATGNHSHNYWYTTPVPTGTGQVRNSQTAPGGTKYTTHTSGFGGHTHGGVTGNSDNTTSSGPNTDYPGPVFPQAYTQPADPPFSTTATGSSTADTATSTGYNGAPAKTSFSLIQPYLAVSVIIRAA